MRSGKGRPGRGLVLAGLVLIAAALALTGYNLWDDWRAGASVSQVLAQMPSPSLPAAQDAEQGEPVATLDPDEALIPDYILDPTREMPTVEIGGSDYVGTLEIPALGLSLPVLSQWSYANLRIAPCRYSGTAYQGSFVIAAHNYRSHFGQLGSLAIGDTVTFTDVDGSLFSYRVAEVQVLEPTAIEEMVMEGWDLTLFTCTIGGQARLTVRCEAAEGAG